MLSSVRLFEVVEIIKKKRCVIVSLNEVLSRCLRIALSRRNAICAEMLHATLKI